MTIKELEKLINENKDELGEESEKSGASYLVMTLQDGRGLVSAGGTARQIAELAMNMMMILFRHGDEEIVLKAIEGFTGKLVEDHLVDVEGIEREETLQ